VLTGDFFDSGAQLLTKVLTIAQLLTIG